MIASRTWLSARPARSATQAPQSSGPRCRMVAAIDCATKRNSWLAAAVVIRTKPAKPERRPFYPSDLLKITRFEALIVAMVARDITNGKNVSESDLERLNTAFERICAVVGEIDEKYA